MSNGCRDDGPHWNAPIELQWYEQVRTESVQLTGRKALPRRGTGHEQQPEIAELDLVAVAQHGSLHWLTVDVGAVEAASVDYAKFAVITAEFGVAAADGDVVEVDDAAGMAARRSQGPVQHESGTSVGDALDDQHS